ncbi:nSTAND1 domain-containing NTPase [Nostoc foliaceum]|uniref:PD40 domain-containing protein n=1 Tax=Nostoc foliaceum FACHB-393 TaxID=2692915 RepID=A0ABR8IJY6_9NOSO|nr:AAA family ATPase [Nostoc foliaceum]MBD2651131.1 PD40 domain-containing protein [Nostoc foliaceum FACHB-393]
MDTQRQSDEPIDNERSLQQLAWTLQASVGKFKLIWARCNYSNLRTRLIERLSEICKIKIQVLQLKESERTLFTAIREELQPDTQALMIVGWESLQDLPQMLTSANQVREEFRKNLSIPVVVWISEEIHHTIMEIAPDLESWGTSRSFAIAQPDLSEFIQQLADEYFNGKLGINDYSILELELEAAQKELRCNDQETEANLASVLGFVKQTNNKIADALEYYQKARVLCQKLNNSEKQVRVLGEIAYCYYFKAFKTKDTTHLDWQATRQYTQEYITFLNEANNQELTANSIAKFGNILRDLKEWEQLKYLAQQALEVHQANNQPIELAKDYGFLAQVALAQSRWSEAKELAQKAKDILPVTSAIEATDISVVVSKLAEEPNIPYDLSLYHFILAQAEYELGEPQQAIQNLEVARDVSSPIKDLQLHLDILSYLQRLYFEKKEYLKAYNTKQQQRSVEQQFGLRAFIGAGRLQSTKVAQIAATKTETQESIAPEIAASGRLLDIERLIERLGRHDHKLIVIHGQSGVGKSSLVNAGLVPALKNKSVGIQDYLPVAMRVYTNWAEELGKLMREALQQKGRASNEEPKELEVPGSKIQASPADLTLLISQLRENEQRNLRTVLIFDQFEEFFFVYTKPKQRQQFFEFLGECLNILSVKVILSLRVDYLHYLLECNRLSSMTIIGNDLLSNNILYELGNFSPDDTKSIIQRLTETTSFQLEQALIEQLVNDLANELGEVRPIELQIVGAQLQTDNITTLGEYQQRGTREELVKRYLAEVVNDCGVENQQIAEILLYLLTDEKGTRPLKTRVELERELQPLAADATTNSNRLDLVLEIFVKSGVVVLLPENPFDRYQLVHDYLATFIRQQQQPKLQELMAELEREKKQRLLEQEQRLLEQEQRLLAQEQLQQSEQAKQILAAANTKATQRIRLGSGVLGISLVLAGITAFFANQAYRTSQEAQTGARLERQGITAWQNFQVQEIEALLLAMQAGQELQQLVKDKRPLEEYPTASPNLALQTILDNIHEQNRLKGHTSNVETASFSPDGKRIVTASFDGTARVWNLSGRQLAEIKGHTSSVNSASFSPDGKHIVTASFDGTVRVWDLFGKPLAELKGHTKQLTSDSFSPDGKRIVIGSSDNTARVWNLSGKLLTEIKGHTGRVKSASFSPDGKRIVTASDDNTARVWDLSGKPLAKLKGHTSMVDTASFSPDGKRIVTASSMLSENTVRVWDLSGKQLAELKGHTGHVISASFSPDGKRIVTASFDGTARVWGLSGEQLAEFKADTDGLVKSASFSPDGKRIVTASSDGTARVWDLSVKQLAELKEDIGKVISASFTLDGKSIVTIVTASSDGTVGVWDLSGKKLAQIKGHIERADTASFSPDGKRIVTASLDGMWEVWDLSGKKLAEFKADSALVNSASFSPDGKHILIASWLNESTVWVWDLSGKKLAQIKGHIGTVNSASFSPDGKRIVTASDDNTARVWVWDLSGKLLTEIKGHTSSVNSASFSPDGKRIVTASDDGTVRVWDLSGKLLTEIKGHTGRVNNASFSPDGKRIVTASDDRMVWVWDLSGKLLTEIKGHTGRVNSASFSPDGKRIVTASDDRTARVWDLSGKLLTELKGHTSSVSYASFSPDGKRIVTGNNRILSTDGTARVWRVDSLDVLLSRGCQWLNDYLVLNPKDLQTLTVCQNKSNLMAAAPFMVKEGENDARAGSTESAIATFQTAFQWNPNLKFDPKVKAAEFANKGKAERLIQEGERIVKENKVQQAVEYYNEAQKLDPQIEISADSWNTLCRQGSLRKKANLVIFACDKAVQLQPYSASIRDSRGLARALTGDTKGAIADFEAYIAQVDDKDTKAQRQRWVKELKAGKNPFTDEELKKLLQ